MNGRVNHADTVRQALDDLGAGYVLRALGLLDGAKKQTRGYMIRCPKHAERTPSCSVQDTTKGVMVNCFGCDWSGDALDLIAVVHGLSTRGANFTEVLAEGARLANLYSVLDELGAKRGPVRELPTPRLTDVATSKRPGMLDAEPFARLVAMLLKLCPLDAQADVCDYLEGRGVLAEARVAGWGALPVAGEQWRIIGAPFDDFGLKALASSGLFRLRDDEPVLRDERPEANGRSAVRIRAAVMRQASTGRAVRGGFMQGTTLGDALT